MDVVEKNEFAVNEDEEEEDECEDENVVVCDIRRGETGGYGFNIKGPTAYGGKMMSVMGKLYPPLQYISQVEENGAAFMGGLRKNDRVLSVNNKDVRGKSHREIVKIILECGGGLLMEVLRIDPDEAARLQRIEDEHEGIKSKANLVICVKGFEDKSLPKPHTVYKICYGGGVRTEKRFSEFDDFQKSLHKRFRWFTFPVFPPKLANGLWKSVLSTQQKEERMIGLNTWLQEVLQQEDIASSELVITFTGIDKIKEDKKKQKTHAEAMKASNAVPKPKAQPQKAKASATPIVGDDDDDDGNKPSTATESAANKKALFGKTLFDEKEETVEDDVALDFHGADEPKPKSKQKTKSKVGQKQKQTQEQEQVVEKEPEPAKKQSKTTILLPGGGSVKVEFPEGTIVSAAEKIVVESLGLGAFGANVFGLFDSSSGKDVKLSEKKLVSQVAASGLKLKKWLFAKQQETNVESDEKSVELLYQQIKSEITEGEIPVDDAAKDKLDSMEESDKAKYLKTVRKLRVYGMISMSACECDYPSEGSLVVIGLQLQRLVVMACNTDGTLAEEEDGPTEFQWESITSYDRSKDKKSIAIKYQTDDEQEETINVNLGDQVSFFQRCAARIMMERDWIVEIQEDDGERSEGNYFLKKLKK